MNFKKFYSLGYLLENDAFNDWEAYVNSIPMLKASMEIIDKLTATVPNSKSYVVGGAVRDIILGKDFDDIDIATNVPLETVDKLFPSHDIGKNKDFGITVVEYKGFNFEVANFRKDGTYTDGRRPDSVEIVPDFKDDASRRDFTINAMAIDRQGNILDYFDGKKDIKDKILRTVRNPKERFAEDYIRMLRAVRFASRMGLQIDPETWAAMQSHSEKIKDQAAERIMKEVIKMAKEPGTKFADAIVMMYDSGILQHILPEIVSMKGFEHSPEHHPEGGVFDHTIAALRAYKGNDPAINLAILLHDIAKPLTYALTDKGTHSYHGHEEKAKEVIESIATRLKFDNTTRDAVIFAATNHMKYHHILEMSNNKVAKLLQSPYYKILEQVALADDKARGSAFDQKEWDAIQDKVTKIRNSVNSQPGAGENLDVIKTIQKKFGGKYIMDLTGLKPGPKLGEVIDKVIEFVLDNGLNINSDEDVKKINDFIISQKD